MIAFMLYRVGNSACLSLKRSVYNMFNVKLNFTLYFKVNLRSYLLSFFSFVFDRNLFEFKQVTNERFSY